MDPHGESPCDLMSLTLVIARVIGIASAKQLLCFAEVIQKVGHVFLDAEDPRFNPGHLHLIGFQG